MLKYLTIEGGILQNKSIPPGHKLVISYVANLGKANKFFYGTYAYMSETLGIRFDYYEKIMEQLLENDILHSYKEGIGLGLLLDTIAERTWKFSK